MFLIVFTFGLRSQHAAAILDDDANAVVLLALRTAKARHAALKALVARSGLELRREFLRQSQQRRQQQHGKLRELRRPQRLQPPRRVAVPVVQNDVHLRQSQPDEPQQQQHKPDESLISFQELFFLFITM